MKIPKTKSDSGSVLVTALIMSAVITLVLGSYLTVLSSRNRITMRSQAWNEAIPVLEAGIEEAFTHMKDDSGSPTANGWSAVIINSNTVYQKTRHFTNISYFNDKSYYVVTISNASSSAPIIYSQGFVPAPLETNYISRLVEVTTTNPSVFSKAVSTKGPITLNGNALVDSFNSSNPLYSSNGVYVASRREANGGVVTDSTNQPAINVGSATINGRTDTGPGGTVTVSGSGQVGDLSWARGIEPGYTNQDMNVSYPDPTLPAGSAGWLPPVLGTVGATNYQYVLGSGNYKLSALTISQSSQSLIVTGNATLYVTGNISVTGNGYIYLAPGSSLTLIEGGSAATLSGGGIVNDTLTAANFSYVGLASNTSITYSGNSSFIGTVNAPEADFTLTGTSDMVGAAIVNTFTDSGGAAIHYDEALGATGLPVMTSYTEL